MAHVNKAKLYDTKSEWDAMHSRIMEHLELDGGPVDWAPDWQVDNEGSDDHGKYIMTVRVGGKYACESFFVANELVDFDDDWFAAS